MFEKKNYPRWVDWEDTGGQSVRWFGTENKLIRPILGAPFPNDYPFKIYQIQNDAPVFEGESVSFFPKNLTINVKLAIQKGFLYDVSKIEPFKNNPLLITKRQDGKFRVITGGSSEDYELADFEAYRIPIFLNGKEMKTIDFSKPESVNDASLLIKIEYKNGIIQGSFNSYGESQIFIVLTLTGGNSTRFKNITRADLMSYSQIKARGSGFLLRKTVIPFFSGFTAARYDTLGSPYGSYEFKAADAAGFSKLTEEELKKKKIYQYYFDLRAGTATDTVENFYDHIFLRV